MRFFKKQSQSVYIIKNVYSILGIVLVWRGVWYVLDWLDQIFFGGIHWWTAVAGVIGGVLLLYLPDRDLREIEKL